MNKRVVLNAAGWLVALAVGLLLPLLMSAGVQVIYIVLILAIINTLGLSLIVGYAGQLSIGQAAFYATGAYTAGLLAVNGVPTVIAFIAAPIASMLVAWVIGIPLLRLSGPFLAFATLAFHLILLTIITQARDLTGGSVGLRGIPVLDFFGLELRTSLDYAWLAVIILFLVMLVARNVLHSRVGRALRGLSASEAAVAATGINVGRVKLSTFVLSAGFGGVAGGVYAFYFGFLSPSSFPVLLAFQFIIMAAVGGMGTLTGPIIGATVITVVVQVLNVVSTQPGMPATAPAILSYTVYALLLILTMIFLPKGAGPAIAQGWRWLRTKLRSRGGEEPSVVTEEVAAVTVPER